jgi:beta-phosphoglucomutase family hydrolase
VARLLGLHNDVKAVLFDLDGVLTDTASLHKTAWKQMFDAFLLARTENFIPFDPRTDYEMYVDGKTRADGVRDFLASRNIQLPEGEPDDPCRIDTVNGLGNRKNAALNKSIRKDGVRVFEGSRRYLEAARDAGLRRAVVSSSANAADVLRVTGLASLVELLVDGNTIREEGLLGKPAPDTYLRAAERLGVRPDQAAVFEDALAGVRAGRAGDFRQVVGVNRGQHRGALRTEGADIVVDDLSELLVDDP